MKYIYPLILTLACISVVQAQSSDWQWAVQGGSAFGHPVSNIDDDEIRAMATDEHGNTYIYTIVMQSALFDTFQVPFTCSSAYALVKYNCKGEVKWARFAGGNSSANSGGMAIGEDGNIYVNGNTSSTNWHIADTLFNFGNAQLRNFIAAFDPQGNRLRQFIGPYAIGIYSDFLQSAPNGYLYAINGGAGGQFAPGINVDSSIFILKVDTLLNPIWAKTVAFQTSSEYYHILNPKLSSDEHSNLYISGYFKDSLKIGGQTLYSIFNPQVNQHVYDGFVAKYNGQGDFLWVREYGEYWGATVRGISVGSNYGYISGGGADSMVIGKDTLHYPDPKLSGPFVAKFDLNGNNIWGRANGGAWGITLSPDEESIWVTGSVSQTAYFDTFKVTATNIVDPVLAKYDTSGKVLFATNISSTGVYEDRGTHITTDPNGNVYVGGTFEGTLMAGDTVTYHGGKRDIFLAKYGVPLCKDTSSGGVGLAAEAAEGFKIYPNPATSSVYLSFEEQPQLVQVYDLNGRLVAAIPEAELTNKYATIDVTGWPAGVFLIAVTGVDGSKEVRKLVKME